MGTSMRRARAQFGQGAHQRIAHESATRHFVDAAKEGVGYPRHRLTKSRDAYGHVLYPAEGGAYLFTSLLEPEQPLSSREI